MNRLQKGSLRMSSMGTVVLLGLVAFGGTAPLALGQDTVQGKFTLPIEARLGKTMLAAGEYRFYVQPLGIVQSISSIQGMNSRVIVVVSGTTKGGTVASAVAMASRPNISNPKGLDVRTDGTGTMIRSMHLEKLGLVLEFTENKAKNTMRARAPELPQGETSVKASD